MRQRGEHAPRALLGAPARGRPARGPRRVPRTHDPPAPDRVARPGRGGRPRRRGPGRLGAAAPARARARRHPPSRRGESRSAHLPRDLRRGAALRSGVRHCSRTRSLGRPPPARTERGRERRRRARGRPAAPRLRRGRDRDRDRAARRSGPHDPDVFGPPGDRSGLEPRRRRHARGLAGRHLARRPGAARARLPPASRAHPRGARSRGRGRDQPPADRRRHLAIPLCGRGPARSAARRVAGHGLPRGDARLLRGDASADPARPGHRRDRRRERSRRRRHQRTLCRDPVAGRRRAGPADHARRQELADGRRDRQERRALRLERAPLRGVLHPGFPEPGAHALAPHDGVLPDFRRASRTPTSRASSTPQGVGTDGDPAALAPSPQGGDPCGRPDAADLGACARCGTS